MFGVYFVLSPDGSEEIFLKGRMYAQLSRAGFV